MAEPNILEMLMNYLSPQEAGAAVIPASPQAQQLVQQTAQSPYGAVVQAAQDSQMPIRVGIDAPIKGAEAWGTTFQQPTGGGRPEVSVAPQQSGVPLGYEWLGQSMPNPPPNEQTLAHELGHVMGTPVASQLGLLGSLGQSGRIDKELMADLIAKNPDVGQLKEILKNQNPPATKQLPQYGDVLHGALGDRAAILIWDGTKPQGKKQ